MTHQLVNINVTEVRDTLVTKVREELKNLTELKDSKMKTHGKFPWQHIPGGAAKSMPEDKITNIFTHTRIFILVKIVAHLLREKAYYELAVKEIGLKEHSPFDYSGYPIEDWIHDVKTRINVIQYEEKKEILQQAEGKLEMFLTEDEKKAKALNDIASALNLDLSSLNK